MRSYTFRLLFALALLVSILAVSLSQPGQKDGGSARSLYQRATADYDAATALGSAVEYDEEKERKLNARALEGFNQVLRQLPDGTLWDSLRFFTLFRLGELHHYFENYSQALSYYGAAISTKVRRSGVDSLLFKPYLYSGVLHYGRNHYDSAAYYFEKAEEVQERFSHSILESERLYNIQGVMNHETGNYHLARQYFLKALEVLPPNHPYYRDLYVNYQINLAQINFKLEDYDAANAIYRELLPFGRNLNEINHNLGVINLHLGAAGKALEYFRKVNYQSARAMRLYSDMGLTFLNLKQLDSAEAVLQRAIQTGTTVKENADPVSWGLTYKTWGDLYQARSQPREALSYYQKAIRQFYPAFTDTSVLASPDRYSGVFSYINLFNTLLAKADALDALYRSGFDRTIADTELETYASAFLLAEYVQRTYTSDEARLFLNRIKYLVHNKPIDLCYALYKRTGHAGYLDQLYVFDQQNKASVLAVQTSDGTIVSKDSVLLNRERDLKSSITRISIRASQAADSSQRAAMVKEIRDRELELDRVQDKLSEASERFNTRIPGRTWLQKSLLDRNTSLLSYHLSEDKLTILHITEEEFTGLQKDLPADFHEKLQAWIQSIRQPGILPDAELGRQLHGLLFDSIAISGKSRLVIIPDDELNYLPFESLPDGEGRYLVQTHSVQYQYSTALLKKEALSLKDQPVLSFAPFTTGGTAPFSALPYSSKEVEALKGRVYTGKGATLQKFLEEVPKYPVLHLATHAVATSDREHHSFIAFSPSAEKHLLYAPEIYTLPLSNTKLTVLSACETGSGELIRGEGIMSLSRAFSYAGCSNIITSLWKADDYATAYLSQRLHHYLDEDYTLDAALQQARLDYLGDKNVNPRMKQPYYWSHLVLIGDYSPSSKTPLFLYILAAFLLVATGFFLVRKKPRV